MSRSTPIIPTTPSKDGEPTWEAVSLLPVQGDWTEADFFRLHTNRMAELVNGRLEVLPMPTWLHQVIVQWLFDQVREHLRNVGDDGRVMLAPLPTRLFAKTVREPDLLYVRRENVPADIRGYPEKIDLAIEVVSEGERAHRRDYEEKRIDYARAGVSEYWIVDPQIWKVTVLCLDGDQYRVGGEYTAGQTATSELLSGLQVDVDDLVALERQA
jgi:Uma2 family endonuclease